MTERTVSELLDLSGKVAIVTGAAGLLGTAMSRGLAEAGATLAVTSRDAERAAAFAATLPGSDHAGFGLAQDDDEAIPGFVDAVVQRLGQVDVLVNNAYGGGAPSIDTASAEDFNQAYHTGVTAYFLLAREVVRHLRSRGASGSIINIASMYGVVASYPQAYTGFDISSPPNYHGLKGWADSPDPPSGRLLGAGWRARECDQPGTLPLAEGAGSRAGVRCQAGRAGADATDGRTGRVERDCGSAGERGRQLHHRTEYTG